MLNKSSATVELVAETGSRMPMKIVKWWEYDCPECDTSNALPDPPFPATHTCRECGRSWNVQKLRAANYIALQQDRIPK